MRFHSVMLLTQRPFTAREAARRAVHGRGRGGLKKIESGYPCRVTKQAFIDRKEG
jgi:hypothetical protein